MNTFIDTILL